MDFLTIPANKKYIITHNIISKVFCLCFWGRTIKTGHQSIEELQLDYYDKNLIENLPSTLKKIYLEFTIDDSNINLFSFLPNSLEEIELNNIVLKKDIKIFDIKLPVQLKKLSFSKKSLIFDFILSTNLIKKNMKYIYKFLNKCDPKKIYEFL